ncbi:MAG: diguanylate cyclase [Desulfobacteraceae bacterium]|nr:diguanylate cyclase [Desulfobacteraceae bacterium]
MAYIEADIDLQITAWNQGAEDLFGYSEKDSLGSFLYKLIPMDKKTLIHCEKAQMQSISHVNYQKKKILCEITYAPINNLKAKKIGIALLAMDVSSRLKEDGDLEQQKQYIEEIYGYAPIGIYHVKLDGKITMANSEYAWMLGYESSDAVLNKITDFPTQVFFDQEKAEEFMFNIFEADQIVRFRCRLKRKDNSYLWALCYAKTTRNELGRIDGFNGFSIDISTTVRTEQALKEANEKLKLISMIDGLTQIPNRRKFDESLESEWNRHFREKTPLSVILCDIDFFKYYNDTYGHQTGDECLKKVASTIHDNSYRSSDLTARYGGEEFVVILPNTNFKSAKMVAERIRTSVKNLKIEHSSSRANKYVTLSLGIATIVPGLDNSAQSLIALADKAMYKAKEKGRNQSIGKHIKNTDS